MSEQRFPGVSDIICNAFECDDPAFHHKTLERTHVEAVQRQVTAIGTGDLGACLNECARDVELEIHCPEAFPWIKRARGLEEVRRALEHNFASVENQVPKVLHVVAQGTIIDITLSETGRIKATKTNYDVIGYQQFIFKDGKVVRVREVIANRTPE